MRRKDKEITDLKEVIDIGNGYATFIEEPTAKIAACKIMMNKFAPNKTFTFTEGDVKPIVVIKIEVQAYTAKKH